MNVDLLCVPYDSALRGWRMGAGPERLGPLVEEHLRAAGHDVALHWIEPESGAGGNPPVEIRTAFELMRALAGKVRAATDGGRFPLVLAGNCNTAAGTVGGLGEGTGIAWFDSHADLNTPETTPTGFLDGMSLSIALGHCWKPLAATIPGFHPVADHDVLLLGARDFDPPEIEFLETSGVTHLSPERMRAGLEPALAAWPARGRGIYVHLDLDVLDPSEGRANVFAAPNGPTLEEMRTTLRALGQHAKIRAAAITAYDPSYDEDGRVARAALALVDALV